MCESEKTKVTGEGLEGRQGERLFDDTADAWLVARALESLHTAEDDGEGQHNYRQVIELLRRCEMGPKTIAQILGRVPASDVPMRWSLLYVLADISDANSVSLFASVASEPIRYVETDQRGCESADDGERLVRVMAVEGIARLANRVEGVVQVLEGVVAKQDDPAVRSAAVQSLRAIDPNSGSRISKVLNEDQQWMLQVRTAGIHEFVAEVEAAERKEIVGCAPALNHVVSRPQVKNPQAKKEC